MADKTLRFLLLGEDRSASKALGGVGKAVGALAGILTAAKLVEWGKDAVDAFRGAEASQRQLEDAYRRFPAVQDVAISSLREYNQALQDKTGADADDLAGSQAILARYKMTGQQLKEITPLLVDYAFRTGKELPAASTTLGKALMGNARAMKELGIEFKDTGDPAQNFGQIVDGLRDKVGGFAESEAQTLDGKMRQLSVRFGDVQEAVGARLVPALSSLLGFVLDNQAAIVPLAGALGVATVALLGFAGGLKALEALKAARAAVDGLKVSIAGMSATARTAVTAMGAVGVALGVASVAYGVFTGWQEEARARVESFTEALQADSGALGVNTRARALNALEMSGTAKRVAELGGSMDTLVDAVLGNDAAWNQWAATTGGLSWDDEQKVRALAGELREAQGAAVRFDAGVTGAANAAGDGADKLGDLADEARDAANALLALSGSQIGLEAAIDSATDSVKENGKTLDITTAKGRANRTALDNIAAAGLGVVDSLNKVPGGSAKADAAMQQSRTAFIKTAVAMGMSKTEARALATSIGLIKPKKVEVKAHGMNPGAVGDLQTKINNLHGKTVTVTAKIVKSGSATWSVSGSGKSFTLADGGILRSFAGGGFENHTAQIARGGDMRLWAEPETGGEAYIPLGASKRQKSLGIWRETGRRLGVVGMADGGMSGGGSSNDGLAQAVAQALNGMSIRLVGANRFADDIAGRIEMSRARGV